MRLVIWFAAPVVSVVLLLAAPAHADGGDDRFIAGYAAAVLEREFSAKASGLTVADGHVTYAAPQLSPVERSELLKALGSIPGVKDVTLTDADHAAVTAPGIKPIESDRVTAAAPAASTQAGPSAMSTAAASNAAAPNAAETKIETDDSPLQISFGIGRTFAPLLADPRWPHFFASYNNYDKDNADTHLDSVGSVGFGETISIFRQTFPSGFRQEAGIQGALFAIFDLDSDSADLINSDFFVGPYYAARFGNFSLLGRLYHQSSHLGDEYLLRDEHEARQNYSFETFNLLLSYDLPYGFRVYGGGGYIFDVDPSTVGHSNVEYGLEWLSPTPVFGNSGIRPVAAVDGQNRDNNDWAFSYSIRAGLQFDDVVRYNQRLQIMLEYYDGNSPNGQFYDDHIRFYGIGAHFYF